MDYSDQHYFNSYDHFGIHEEMLKDSVRTTSYRDAIYRNRDLFKDKVVLDVGCGSGILSMFAAKAGAKHVIGVDMSNIIDMARKVIDANGLSDKITLLKGKMEEVVLPYKQVDIIVSEWMGYFLLYEAMLDTVLYARDRYLVKDGLILPDKATMHIAAIEDSEYKSEKIDFWDNVYGFDYSPFKDIALRDPLVDIVEDKNLLTEGYMFKSLDLYTVTKEQLAFTSEFKLNAFTPDTFHGFVVWFDIDFEKVHNKVHFSTGPAARATHWKQCVFYTKENHILNFGDVITGTIQLAPNARNPRDVDISLNYQVSGKEVHELNYVMC